ncbi:MAG: thiamine pyrophosphate-requiring protein [Chloroflexota bacterium]
MKKRAAVESTAEAYLEILAARGVRYFFGNGGTDFGPIVDAYAKRLSSEAPVPAPITVPHEIDAVAMAHGYTMVTGEPQVVMVHTIAGTANATGNVINASRAGVPVLFSAGRTPLTEGDSKGSRDGGIHWAQESFDQGAMVREWVKWDYELRHDADVEAIVDRALAIAQTQPQGPVYLTLPREVLAEAREEITYMDRPRMIASDFMPTPELLENAAKALAAAKDPVIVTRSAGRDPAAVAELVRLAEALNIPVYETGPTHMNFPVMHPLHQGSDSAAALARADVVLVVECDVPWPPKRVHLRPEALVIAAGVDPLYSRYPVRGFPIDLGLAGNLTKTLGALAELVTRHPREAAAISARGKALAVSHQEMRAATTARALAGKDQTPIQKPWVSYCLEQLRDEDTIVLNELGLDASQFELTQPGSYFTVSQAGILGWAVGAALGAKLAAPEKTVVACVGDGSYVFGVPSAAHWVARRYELPVLYIIWNNAQWAAVAGATRTVYPDGWAVKTASFPFSDLTPALDFEHDVKASGGYGERVETAEQVPAALERALHAVKVEKRAAVLNMVAAPRQWNTGR